MPAESLHSALSTRVMVLSSFTVSESGVLSSYSTTAEYMPERRRLRTSSSPASTCSRLNTEPLALRRTIVLQRALTAPRMCPALKARNERQSNSRHLALSSFRSRFSNGQSISHSSSIARSFQAVRAGFTDSLISFISVSLCLHLPPGPAVDSLCASPLFAHLVSRGAHCNCTTFTHSPATSFSLVLSSVSSLDCFAFFLPFFNEWVHRVTAEVTSTDISLSQSVQFLVPFPPLPFIHKKRQTSMKRESMGMEIGLYKACSEVWHSCLNQLLTTFG